MSQQKARRHPRNPRGYRAWRHRSDKVEPAAGQDGRPISGAIIRRNGRTQFVCNFTDVLDTPIEEVAEPSRLSELQRRFAKVRAQYRLSGDYSDLEKAIMDFAFDGLSLSAVGKRIGMERQGVWYHVQQLLPRALAFRNFWRYKHRMKRRK